MFQLRSGYLEASYQCTPVVVVDTGRERKLNDALVKSRNWDCSVIALRYDTEYNGLHRYRYL